MNLPHWQSAALGFELRENVVQKFGYNDDVDAAEDVWLSGGAYTGFLAAAAAVEVVSGSADDAVDGTGAETVVLIGLDASGNPQTETISMNGITAVDSAYTWLRVQRAYVLDAGTGGTNAGVITIRVDGAGATLATIGVGYGQTLIAAYTIPATMDGYILNWSVTVGRVNSLDGYATVALQTRANGGAWRTREVQELGSGRPFSKDVAINLDPLTDIRVSVLSVSAANTKVSAQFNVLERVLRG